MNRKEVIERAERMFNNYSKVPDYTPDTNNDLRDLLDGKIGESIRSQVRASRAMARSKKGPPEQPVQSAE